MSDVFAFGYGRERAEMQFKRLNRHGIIAGATGKTVTLKVLAEQLSDAGIPILILSVPRFRV